jgi:hypothetical protein
VNPYAHAQISAKRRGGKPEDYLAVHEFMDCTKQLCADNRHRILHNHWGIANVITPIFGHQLINSDRRSINIKDMLEQDHLLPDFQNKFIPTLADFVYAIDDSAINEVQANTFYAAYKHDKEIADLLLSPFIITGKLKALLITHNSWFINHIVPRVLNREVELKDFSLNIDHLFNHMKFELWMDNGADVPASYLHLKTTT